MGLGQEDIDSGSFEANRTNTTFLYLYVCKSPLSGASCAPRKFEFHLVFFPAACSLSREELRVVSVVTGIAAFGSGIVDFFSNPSLARRDWKSAIGALVRTVSDHLSSCSQKGNPRVAHAD